METTVQGGLPGAVAQLQKEKDALDTRLSALMEKIKAGVADAEEIASLPEVAADCRRVKTDLEIASREAEEAQAQAAAREDKERRVAFDEAIRDGTVRRQEFERLFHATCLAYGRFCASVDKAGLLANQLGHWRLGGQWPDHRAVIDELTKDIDPLPLLRDSLRTRTGFGWNLSVMVAPLEEK